MKNSTLCELQTFHPLHRLALFAFLVLFVVIFTQFQLSLLIPYIDIEPSKQTFDLDEKLCEPTKFGEFESLWLISGRNPLMDDKYIVNINI